MLASMNGPYARSRSSHRSRPSGVSACWNVATCGEQRLGAVDLVDRADLVRAEVASSRSARSASTLSMPRVIRSSTDSASSGIASRVGPSPRGPPRSRLAPGLRRVVQPVVVAGVAVDRRRRRVQAEELLPERGADLVHRGRLGRRLGHAGSPGRRQAVWVDAAERRRGYPAARDGAPAVSRTAPAGPRPLDVRVEAQQRLEVRERRRRRARPVAEVVRLEQVPAAGLERVAQERRPVELVADELGALREHDEEPHDAVVVGHPGMAAEDGLAAASPSTRPPTGTPSGRGRTR